MALNIFLKRKMTSILLFMKKIIFLKILRHISIYVFRTVAWVSESSKSEARKLQVKDRYLLCICTLSKRWLLSAHYLFVEYRMFQWSIDVVPTYLLYTYVLVGTNERINKYFVPGICDVTLLARDE